MKLRDRLCEALERNAGFGPSADDYRVATDLVPAAVLIPITDRPEPGVILTLRNANLSRHAGQVAFPGGRIDPQDTDAVAGALREAEEEVGLSPALVEVIGQLDLYRTGTGFEITPVLGIVPPDFAYSPHVHEVSDVFEVPLGFLLERANHALVHADHEGRQRRYYQINWGERRIWGATAGMIVNLASRLDGLA